MKRFLSLALCLIMCLSTICCVNIYAAEEPITLSTSFDALKGELVVSGTVAASKGNIPMTLVVLDSKGNALDAVNTIGAKNEEGVIEYEFAPVTFFKTTATDIYTIIVSCDFIYKKASTTFNFPGIDIKRTALEGIDKAYDDNKAVDSAIAVIDKYYNVFGFGEEFASYNKTQKEIVANFIFKQEYNVPDDNDALTTEEVDSVFDQTIDAAILAAEGKAIAEFVGCNDLPKWAKDYAIKYDFYVDDEKTDYNEAELAKYFDEAAKNAGFISASENCYVDTDSFKDLAQNLYEESILYLSANSNYYMTRDILENSAIASFIPIDRTSFEALSSEEATSLYSSICNSSYNSIDEFVTAVNKKVYSLNSYSGPSSPVSGDRDKPIKSGVVVSQAQNTITTIFPFTDLVGLEWAQEPIQKLYYLGVVRGTSETEFTPNGLVTRAEFAKMIVGALGLTLDAYEGTFADVSADSWYAPYVQTAYNKGIVKGNGSTFNPNGYITREDISVMIFRALNLSATEEEVNILDKANISDYAVDAIFTLYNNGIMSGDGTGNVYPKDNATRAEAAKLVYKSFVE